MKRKELTAAEKRKRKLKWLRKLYKDAKNAELIQEDDNLKHESNIDNLYSNPFEEKRFEEYGNNEFDKEVNALIEWCEDLDYEQYTKNWHEIATSNKPELPATTILEQPYKITSAELGGFTLENSEIMGYQQELGP